MIYLLKALSFFVLGSGVKYIDAAYDDGVFSTAFTVPLALLLGLLAGTCMIWDHDLLLISLSILVGVLVTGKLDVLPFRLLALVCLTTTLTYFAGKLPLHGSDWPILLCFASGAALDEIGNDLADAGVLRGRLAFFFLNRGFLKVLVAIIVTVQYLSASFLLLFLAFDFGYFLFTFLSQRRSKLTHRPMGA
jgi:hypothetical protein